MPAAPLIAMKSTKCTSLEAVGKELDRRAHTYVNDVDRSKSHLNRYYVCCPDVTQPEPLERAIDRRMGELNTKRAVRKDAVKAMGFIVSTNNQLDEERAHEFLNDTLLWFGKRYGNENILAAAEHFDEGTPHLQFWLAPVIHDPETGYDRLSAKELFAPDKRRKNENGEWEVVEQGTMSQLQHDFWREVSSRYGFEQPLDRYKRAKGYRSLEAFKTHTGTTRELKAVLGGLEAARDAKAREVQELEGQAFAVGQQAATAKLHVTQLEGQADELAAQLEAKQAEKAALEAEIAAETARLESVRRTRAAFESGELRARSERSRKRAEELKPQVSAAKEEVARLDERVGKLESGIERLRGRMERLRARIEGARTALAGLKTQARTRVRTVTHAPGSRRVSRSAR